jgi:SAM-dependent methyltransferase
VKNSKGEKIASPVAGRLHPDWELDHARARGTPRLMFRRSEGADIAQIHIPHYRPDDSGRIEDFMWDIQVGGFLLVWLGGTLMAGQGVDAFRLPFDANPLRGLDYKREGEWGVLSVALSDETAEVLAQRTPGRDGPDVSIKATPSSSGPSVVVENKILKLRLEIYGEGTLKRRARKDLAALGGPPRPGILSMVGEGANKGFYATARELFQPGLHVIDFGSGDRPSWAERIVRTYGVRYTGIDINLDFQKTARQWVRAGQKRLPEGMSFFVHDYLDPLPARIKARVGPGDIVTLHSPNPGPDSPLTLEEFAQAAVEQMFNALKPGGVAIIYARRDLRRLGDRGSAKAFEKALWKIFGKANTDRADNPPDGYGQESLAINVGLIEWIDPSPKVFFQARKPDQGANLVDDQHQSPGPAGKEDRPEERDIGGRPGSRETADIGEKNVGGDEAPPGAELPENYLSRLKERDPADRAATLFQKVVIERPLIEELKYTLAWTAGTTALILAMLASAGFPVPLQGLLAGLWGTSVNLITAWHSAHRRHPLYTLRQQEGVLKARLGFGSWSLGTMLGLYLVVMLIFPPATVGLANPFVLQLGLNISMALVGTGAGFIRHGFHNQKHLPNLVFFLSQLVKRRGEKPLFPPDVLENFWRHHPAETAVMPAVEIEGDDEEDSGRNSASDEFWHAGFATGGTAVTAQEQAAFAQKGRSAFLEWSGTALTDKQARAFGAVQAIMEAGSLQAGLSSGFEREPTLRTYVQNRLESSAVQAFFAQLGVLVSGRGDHRGLANLGRQARRMGLTESQSQILVDSVGQLPEERLDSQAGAVRRAIRKANSIKDLVADRNFSEPLVGPVTTSVGDRTPVVLFSLDGLAEGGRAADITAQNALAFALQGKRPGQLGAFSARIDPGKANESREARQRRLHAARALWMDRLLAAGQPYGLTRDMLAGIDVIFVEADELMDRNALLKRAVQALSPRENVDDPSVLNRYTLGAFYTASSRELGLESLGDCLVPLGRLPLLDLLRSQLEDARVYATQA